MPTAQVPCNCQYSMCIALAFSISKIKYELVFIHFSQVDLKEKREHNVDNGADEDDDDDDGFYNNTYASHNEPFERMEIRRGERKNGEEVEKKNGKKRPSFMSWVLCERRRVEK